MEITTIFEKTRDLLGDKGYNSNDSSSDKFWSDDTLIGHLNMALFDFDFKTNYKQIGYDDVLYQFDTVIGQDLYDLPSDILRVKSITADDRTIYETSYKLGYECAGQPVPNHRPEFYSLNYQDKKIIFSYPVDAVYKIKFRAVVAEDRFTLSSLNTELPLPEKYHEFFKYFIASKCLEFRDADTQSLNDSQYFMGEWNSFCRQVKLEITRRTNNIVCSNNGCYNTW